MAYSIGDKVYPFIIRDKITRGNFNRLEQAQKETEIRYNNDPDRIKHKNLYLKYGVKEKIFKPFKPANNTTWILCECIDCHRLHWMFEYNLNNGHAQSCPVCKQKRTREDYTVHYNEGSSITPRKGNDLRGKTFYHIIVTDDLPTTSGNGHCNYTCKCLLCGNLFQARQDRIVEGQILSCPNCSTYDSVFEEFIGYQLEDLGLTFNRKIKFPDLTGLGGKQLSYDFGLTYKNHNVLIEGQGKQHYEPVEIFGGEEQFVIQQEHDNRKRKYAEAQGYKLIEIRYDCKDVKKYIIDSLKKL